MVRFSIRPCPLSTLHATLPGGGGGSKGGEGGCLPPLLRLELQAGRHIDTQGGLVLLDEQHVVPAAVHHRRAEVPLAEGGVTGKDAAPDRQDAEQFQRRLVLVRLGVHPQLGQHGPGGRGVGGDQMQAGDVTVPAAAGGLAVDTHMQPVRGAQPGGHPAAQGGLEGGHVEGAEEGGQAGLGGRLAAAEAECPGEGEPVVAAELGDGGVGLAAGEHGQDGQAEDGG